MSLQTEEARVRKLREGKNTHTSITIISANATSEIQFRDFRQYSSTLFLPLLSTSKPWNQDFRHQSRGGFDVSRFLRDDRVLDVERVSVLVSVSVSVEVEVEVKVEVVVIVAFPTEWALGVGVQLVLWFQKFEM